MKNLFVPYEIALTLKEKGFDEECLRYYGLKRYSLNTEYATDIGELLTDSVYSYLSSYQKDLEVVKAPLYQQVVDWFRDKHSIYIAVLPFREKSDVSDEYGIELCWYYSLVQDDEDLPDILCNEDDLGAHGLNYATPKEAWDEAFKQALKLI